MGIKARLIIISILLIVALGGVVLEANATLKAVQSLPQQEGQARSGDIHLIGSWMTVPYIAHTYQIPDTLLFQSLHVQDTHENRHGTLQTLALHTHRPIDQVIHHVQVTILSYRQHHPFKHNSLPTYLHIYLAQRPEDNI